MSTLVAESFMKSANNSSTGILPNTSITISGGKVVKVITVKLPFFPLNHVRHVFIKKILLLR